MPLPWNTTKGANAHKVQLICPTCGKEFIRYRNDVKDVNFCSISCFAKSFKRKGEGNPNWRGGISQRRGPRQHWAQVRAQALQRAGFKCEECGKDSTQSKLYVHHIVPFNNFTSYKKANALSNLKVLCIFCHMAIERNNKTKQLRLPLEFKNLKICRECGSKFIPNNPKSVICSKCRIVKCLNCGKPIWRKTATRKRPVCSRECFVSYIKKKELKGKIGLKLHEL